MTVLVIVCMHSMRLTGKSQSFLGGDGMQSDRPACRAVKYEFVNSNKRLVISGRFQELYTNNTPYLL